MSPCRHALKVTQVYWKMCVYVWIYICVCTYALVTRLIWFDVQISRKICYPFTPYGVLMIFLELLDDDFVKSLFSILRCPCPPISGRIMMTGMVDDGDGGGGGLIHLYVLTSNNQSATLSDSQD